jgi:cell division protein FtsQ
MRLIVFSKNNRKRPGNPWKRCIWAAAGIAGIGVLGLALYQWGGQAQAAARVVRLFVLDNPYFAVREIQVRGTERVRGGELVALAGLRNGMTIWNIDPVAIEKKLARHPWLRRVVVRREFPRRVLIEVTERVPKAIIAVGRLYYVDGDGLIFAEVSQADKLSLPMITGLRPEQVSARDAALRRRLKEAVQLGELMAVDQHKISEIHFSAPERVVLYTTALPTALHMGWGDWRGKVERVKRIFSLWRGHEERLASLDVSFAGQAVVRIKNAQQQSFSDRGR